MGVAALRRATLLAALLSASVRASTVSTDPRNVANGKPIGEFPYSDQAYCVVGGGGRLPAGRWLCVVTVSGSGEGAASERVVSTYSDDDGDTWSVPVALEPAATVPVAYGVPSVSADGRVAVVYNMNSDNVTRAPDGTPLSRHDEMGHFKLRVSDDGGLSWGSRNYEVPYRITPVDEGNMWGGGVKLMWTVDHPSVVRAPNGSASWYMAFTKIGKYVQNPPEEVWVLHSPNLQTEADPAAVTWQLLPDGQHGVANPLNASTGVAEEGHFVALHSGAFYVMFRTEDGWLGEASSSDGGHSWSPSTYATYAPLHDSTAPPRRLKNPRGPITPRRLANDMYLLLYYNNGYPAPTYRNRNPYWLAAGRLSADGRALQWSQPEIALYDASQTEYDECCGYPDFIERPNGDVVIVETNKKTAATHLVNRTLLDGLFNQFNASGVPTTGLTLRVNASAAGTAVPAPPLPDFAQGQGLTLAAWLQHHAAARPGDVLFDTTTTATATATAAGAERGVRLGVSRAGAATALTLSLRDGNATANTSLTLDAACAAALLDGAAAHFVAVVADGGARILTAMVDGALCDGGGAQRQGWAWFNAALRDVNGAATAAVARPYGGTLLELTAWGRALRTSELVAAWRAGPGAAPAARGAWGAA